MKIEVTRVVDDGKLVFTITCKEGGIAPLEKRYVKYLTETNGKKEFHDIFARDVIAQTMFIAFKKELRAFFLEWSERIAEEVYSWCLDAQEGDIEAWVKEWASGRSKYYFDNDKTIENTKDNDG